VIGRQVQIARGRTAQRSSASLARSGEPFINSSRDKKGPLLAHPARSASARFLIDPDAALTLIDQGLAAAQETGEHYTDPYLHRLRGEVLFRRDPANPVPAEEAFQTALAIAKQQRARSYELLASLFLAKLHQSTRRLTEAQAVLAPALEGFSPTPEMPEIAEAQALLVAIEAAAHASPNKHQHGGDT
jgi:hypothetical protein